MKLIKASEIKPGMTIRWDSDGITYQCKVDDVTPSIVHGFVNLDLVGGGYIRLGKTPSVTVLSEPAPPQPEEPTEFGSRVRVRDGRFVRLGDEGARAAFWLERGTGYQWTWDDLCEMGPVAVVPDQGWTPPAEAPVVPERIEEWPENDTALRYHRWRDVDGDTWTWAKAQAKWECRDHRGGYQMADGRPPSLSAPFTRVVDA